MLKRKNTPHSHILTNDLYLEVNCQVNVDLLTFLISKKLSNKINKGLNIFFKLNPKTTQGILNSMYKF